MVLRKDHDQSNRCCRELLAQRVGIAGSVPSANEGPRLRSRDRCTGRCARHVEKPRRARFPSCSCSRRAGLRVSHQLGATVVLTVP